MSIDPMAVERLNRWRNVGDGPTTYTAGSKQFSDDVIVLLEQRAELLAALYNVRKLIADASMTGFNYKDGDWADRLFASQQVTSAAIRKAEAS